MPDYLDCVVSVLTDKGWEASLLGSATVTATTDKPSQRYDSIVIECSGNSISAEISRHGSRLTYRPAGYKQPLALVECLIEAFSHF
jgi:hypothetical protein